MPLFSRRLDQIIARRRHAKPKDRARHLINVRYQLDGITDTFPTTETPYIRTPFTWEPYPVIWDVTPLPEHEVFDREHKVTFGTITELPLDNPPLEHPTATNFPITHYHDWNTHASVLLDFLDFSNCPYDEETRHAVVKEYWEKRYLSLLPICAIPPELRCANYKVPAPPAEASTR